MENEALMLGLKYVGKGLLALGALGAAIGVGNVFSAYLSGVARNPSAGDRMFAGAMIGAAFAEALGLISFVMMFIL
jgi:F-type H+-transporting ATPase subunit c